MKPVFKLIMSFISMGMIVHAQSPENEPEELKGMIAGQVVNNSTGSFISEVKVLVSDTDLSTTTDVEGRYRIRGVPEGEHEVVFLKNSYQTLKITEVSVEGENPHILDVGMNPDYSGLDELEAFNISASEIEVADIALLAEREKAAAFSNAIGRDGFAKYGVGDAAEALTRVTGVSVVDGKYAVIRGLGDRYANTQLNVASLPNPDPDQQTAQLDLFPSSLLESVVTRKTFTPDMPGNTSGGSVSMKTKAFPEEMVFEISAGAGYNSNATRNGNFLADDTIDVSTLAATKSDFPEFEEFDLDQRANEFSSSFIPARKGSGLNKSFSAAYGNTFFLGNDRELGVTAGLSWSNSFEHLEGMVENRFLFEAGASELRPRQESITDKSTEEVFFGGQGGVGFKLNQEHQFRLLGLHTRAGTFVNQDTVFTLDEGVDSGFNPGREDVLLRFQSHYTERTLTNIQLSGISRFTGWKDLKLDWVLSWSDSTQDEPDLRGGEVTALGGDREDLFIAEQFTSTRTFRELNEERISIQADFSLPFHLQSNLPESELKFGLSYSDSDNQFRQQGIIFVPDLPESIEGPSIPGFDDTDPIRKRDGLETLANVDDFLIVDTRGRTQVSEEPREFTPFTGFSDDTLEISALYLMSDANLSESWRVIGGFRVERTEIDVDGGGQILGANPNIFPQNLRTGTSDIRQTDFLPAISAVYQVKEDMNLRFSWSRTLARPSFRELAPYFIEDAAGGDVFRGNPEGIPDLINPGNETILEPLQLSDVTNYDARWEWYRNESDFFSISLFYKELDQPIEQSNIGVKPGATPANTQPLLISFGNNPNQATLKGIELEARKGFSWIPALEFISIGGNATYIDAEVGFREDEIALISALTGRENPGKRRLQDQPEWILNADLSYNNPFSGTRVTAAFFWISDELKSTAGVNTLGTFTESYHTFDVIASKVFGREGRWKVKFSAKNLTDSVRETFLDKQFTNGNPLLHTRYHLGRDLSLSFSYSY